MDLIHQSLGKALDQVGVEHQLFKALDRPRGPGASQGGPARGDVSLRRFVRRVGVAGSGLAGVERDTRPLHPPDQCASAFQRRRPIRQRPSGRRCRGYGFTFKSGP
jgi:hypothetical protein